MAMYTESMLPPVNNMWPVWPGTWSSFAIAFGGLNGGAGLAAWVGQLFNHTGFHGHTFTIFLKLTCLIKQYYSVRS